MYTVYRVGSGASRPPVRIGSKEILEEARSLGKNWIRDLYEGVLPTRLPSEYDNWVEIVGEDGYLEAIFPGHGRKYAFISEVRSGFPLPSDDEETSCRHGGYWG